MYQGGRCVLCVGMGRVVAVLLLVCALAACGGGGGAPSYSDPGAMAKKAWGPAGISSCGGQDEGGTLVGAHFVICDTGSGQLRFIAAQDEAAAEAQARVAEAMGMTAVQRGSWVVGGDGQDVVDRAVAALS